MSEAVEHLNVLSGDGRGGVLTPEMKKRGNKAIEDGTDTVATTYALYQITQAIPRLEKATRQPTIDQLKQQVKDNKATLCKSLEDECLRLVS